MVNFMIRNIKLYFRDRAAVFFSLLSVFIVLGLYVLFLGNTYSQEYSNIPGGKLMIDSWIMAGLLSITAFTTTLGGIGNIVDDKTRKIAKDFYSSPISRGTIIGGYILSAFLIGCLMSLLTLALTQIYFVASGEAILPLDQLVKAIGILLLSSFSAVSLFTFITMFIKTQNAFSSLSILFGTIIGFLTGSYIPLGEMSSAVQKAVMLFPASHTSSLLRKTMMASPIAQVFEGAPQLIADQTRRYLGVDFYWNGTQIPEWLSVVYLAGSGLVFFLLSIWVASRKRE